MASPPAETTRARLAAAICVGLLLLFGALSFDSARRSSPTFDEPLHALAGWTSLQWHDFRLNDEHPPLWKYWAALPHAFAPQLRLNPDSEDWKRIPADHNAGWRWTIDSLFRTPGNDGDAFVLRARCMMLLVGLGLGAFIARWSWRVGGPAAAIAATAAFAFDPSFIAHSSLVTNDVAAALLFAGIIYFTWKLGEAITWRRTIGIALLVGVAVVTKLSLLLAGPLMVLLLGLRAFLPKPWPIWGRPDAAITRRLASLAALVGIIAVVTFGVAWASYGFRFRTAPDPSVQMDLQANVWLEKRFLWELSHDGEMGTEEQVAGQPLTLFSRMVLALHEGHLLPEPLLDGWLYANSHSLVRRNYFLGNVARYGQGWYFPVAFLAKTPLATLGAVILTIALLAWSWRRREGLWTALCLTIPPAVYFAVAVRSNLNLGLRHIFPIYPFLFVGIGWAVARVVAERRQWAVAIAAVLGLALAVESLRLHPDELTFFNVAVGGPEGGLSILGDSNLDWGQGLKDIKRWQDAHPQEKLHLAYFGTADPAFYGIRATRLTYRQQLVFSPELKTEPGVLAFSATVLQGLMLDPDSRSLVGRIRWKLQPAEVLGHSVYLYRSADVLAALQEPSKPEP
jgi:hypothetical protein